MNDLIKRAKKHAEEQRFSYDDSTTANIINALLEQLEQKDQALTDISTLSGRLPVGITYERRMRTIANTALKLNEVK